MLQMMPAKLRTVTLISRTAWHTQHNAKRQYSRQHVLDMICNQRGEYWSPTGVVSQKKSRFWHHYAIKYGFYIL